MSVEFEEKIIRKIDKRREEIVNFVASLIKTPSTNPPGNEKEIVEVIKKKARNLNLGEGEIVAKVPERPNIVFSLKGKDPGNRLFFNGHLDTKPAGDLDKWETDPFSPTFIDNKIFGLGSSDMKAAVGAMLYALGFLKEYDVIKKGELKLLLTADEEAITNFGASYLCNNYDLQADFGLIGEPAGITKPWEKIFIANRRLLGFKMIVEGTQIHSSLSEHLNSINANQKMCWVIDKINKDLEFSYNKKDEYSIGITKNIGMFIEGGINYGIYPGRSECKSELRVPPEISRDILFNEIKRFIQRLKKEDKNLHIEIKKEIPANKETLNYPYVRGDEPFVRFIRESCQKVLGYSPSLDLFPGGTDASVFQEIKGIPTISAFGPGILKVCHQPNEYVYIDDIIKATKMYVLIATRYLS